MTVWVVWGRAKAYVDELKPLNISSDTGAKQPSIGVCSSTFAKKRRFRPGHVPLHKHRHIAITLAHAQTTLYT